MPGFSVVNGPAEGGRIADMREKSDGIATPIIRPYEAGDAAALRRIFYSAVHQTASADYTPRQCAAWAPAEYDAALWAEKCARRRPIVASIGGQCAGYSDLQPDGLIDHFYVAGAFARRGVGRALMAEIERLARASDRTELYSHVSLTAEPFFAKFGFTVERRQLVEVRGETLANALMRKRLR